MAPSQIRHELAGIGETGDITEFRDQCGRHHQTHPAQRLQRMHHRCQRPVRQRCFDMRLQAIAPCRRGLDGSDTILQHDVVHGLFEPQSGQPATVHLRPGRSVVVMAMTQQETG